MTLNEYLLEAALRVRATKIEHLHRETGLARWEIRALQQANPGPWRDMRETLRGLLESEGYRGKQLLHPVYLPDREGR